MEEFSRRVLVALMVAAAGPGAGMLTLLLVGPTLVAASMPDTEGGIVETVGSLLVGLLIGGMLSVVVAYFVAAAATLVALRATGCPRPHLAWIICLVLSPMWLAALSSLDLDPAGLVVLSGVLPGAVRLGFGYLEPPGRRTGDLVPPRSEIW
jgi:hypothetical protein